MLIRSHKIALREPVYDSFDSETRSYTEFRPLPAGVVALQDIVAHAGKAYGGNLTVDGTRSLYADGTGARARVVPTSSRAAGARRSWKGRRCKAACWHAYRDAMLAIFDIDPDAVIVTTMARYDGRDGFMATYPATADQNIGSMARDAYMPELCDCEGPLATEHGDPADIGARVRFTA